MAQTEVGSFIVNIEIQVTEENTEQLMMTNDMPPPHFGHRVVNRIHTAITQIDEAVIENKDLESVAMTAYETGITANMCDALLKMKPSIDNTIIDTTIRYTTAITDSSEQTKHIVIKNCHFGIINELSGIYREKNLFQDVVLTGIVRSLSKRNLENTVEKTIKLLTNFDNKLRTIVMKLSGDNYRNACDAHRDEEDIEVSGELDMSN